MRSRRIEKLFENYRTRADGAALAAVFDATAPRLFELACHLVRDPSEAEDLVQSTFLAAIRHAQRYDASAPLEGWLYGILWREALKAKRRAARRVDPRDVDQPAQSEPADALAAAELPQAVREALERLPQHEREVLEPFLLEDLRADEIAHRLERSAGTVRSQIHRALGRLRRNLPAGLTPLAGLVPIRGLDVVRAEVLKAAGVPATTAAAVVGGGVGSRVLVGAVALVLAVGGWIGLKLALEPAESNSTPVVAKLETDPAASTRIAVESSPSERAPEVTEVSKTATIALTLVNWPKEHPVVGLRVEVWPGVPPKDGMHWPAHEPSETPVASGNTSADGRIELELPAGEQLRLELPWQGSNADLSGPLAPYWGKMFDLGRLAPAEHRSLRFQILYGWEFPRRARLVADEDGHPLPDARVLCTGWAPSGRADSVLSTSAENSSRWRNVDSSGSFELLLTYEQRFDTYFAMLAPGRTPLLTRLVGFTRSDEPSEYRLLRSAALHARLIDDSGVWKPPYRFRLAVEAHDLMQREADKVNGWDAWLAWEGVTDVEGRIEFPELPANARIDVKAFKDSSQVFWINGGSPEAPRLSPGESRDAVWHLRVGSSVSGLALDEDLQPVPNHEVWLLRMVIDAVNNPGPIGVLVSDDDQMVVAKTRTDADGRFSLEGVAPGTWWVGIAPPPDSFNQSSGLKPLPLAVQFEVPKDVSQVGVTIRRRTSEKVRGTVVGPDGSPVAGASILVSKGVSQSFSDECGISTADGKFEVVLKDGGDWWVGAWAPDAGLTYSDPIQVKGAQDGIVLKPIRAASISGEVVCSECGEDARTLFDFLGTETGSLGLEPVPFRTLRTFRLDDMRPGTYHLWVRCEPDRVGFLRGIKLDSGAVLKGLRVELTQAAVLVLRNRETEPGSNFTLCFGDVTTGSMDVPKGEKLRVIVPPGVVKLRLDEGGAERVLTVKAGTETEIVLDDN